jgi:hypothetical protein
MFLMVVTPFHARAKGSRGLQVRRECTQQVCQQALKPKLKNRRYTAAVPTERAHGRLPPDLLQ